MKGSMSSAVVYGCGGHGKVVADILVSLGCFELRGFLDDGVPSGQTILGLPTLGGAQWLKDPASKGISIALGVGDNRARQRVADRCLEAGFNVLTPIHPSAVVSRTALLGIGTVVMANAVVNPEATVGLGAVINTGAVVEHDCVVGDYDHLSPNSVMGGGAKIGALSHLGLGAAILPGITVGGSTTVGAGGVVVNDLPDGVIAVGVPARARRGVT